ncbi:hypothetical protein C8R43DRAFT_1009720 [Mycena crocata]|nr:hypothetical protein C8R43DRAFT_1009720 [Mycena crocata]
MLCESCNAPLVPPAALPTLVQTDSLRDLLRSSQFPSDPSHYRSQIASSTLILSQYDAEIERLEKALQALNADRLDVQDYLDGCRSALAPVRQLPPEILGQIFAPFSLVPSREANNRLEELHVLAKFDLLRLSQVCCHWHRLIMGTPSLWSHIAVHARCWPKKAGECAPFLDLLDTSLERGADSPLSIRFYSGPYIRDVDGVILRLLAQHSQRWRHVDLCVPGSHLEHISSVQGNLAALQTLSLMIESDEGAPPIHDITTLTNVSLGAVNPRQYPNLPWNQLVSFTYDAYDVNDIGSLLDLTRKVPHPEAAFALRHVNKNYHPILLDLPSVTSTIISFTIEIESIFNSDSHRTPRLLGAILGSLTLPRLRELCFLRNGFRLLSWPLSQFLALSLRSSFSDTLLSLDIRHITLTEDDLIHSLASLTSLERLLIADQDHNLVTDSLLRRLTLTPDPNSRLVPRLKYFSCACFLDFDANIYFNFVASRVLPGTAPFHGVLRYFYGVEHDFDAAVLQKLLNLAAKGSILFQLEEN